eukprot:5712146-Pleurochrysis_carterae.AAC.1
MARGPVGVGEADQAVGMCMGRLTVAQSYACVPAQIEKHAFCCLHERLGGAAHGAAQHADRVRDVGSRVRGAVDESPDKALITPDERFVLGAEVPFGNSELDQGGEIGLCRCVVLLETRWNTLGRVCGEELLDVRRLTKHNVTALDCDVDVEEVGHFSFVFDAPAVDERCGELAVEAVRLVARVKDKEVVHVTTDDELVVSAGFAEDAR